MLDILLSVPSPNSDLLWRAGFLDSMRHNLDILGAAEEAMVARIEPISELNDIVPLLAECALPVSDISSTQARLFFGIRSESVLVAVVGLELLGSVGLLRSLAVTPSHRGRGLARQLVAFAERVAAAQGVNSLFLLTTTAAAFFSKLGFVPASRAAAPLAIQATAQFSSLCPVSSEFLCKSVAGLSNHSS